MRPLFSLVVVSAVVVGCGEATPPSMARPPAPPPSARTAAARPPAGVVRYFDREVALGDMLQGFPYRFFVPDVASGDLYFIAKGDTDRLRRVALEEGPIDLGRGSPLSDVDWSTRNLWRLVRHPRQPVAWMLADARNEERMNVWTLDLEGGQVRALTDADYVYGFGLDEAYGRLAYVARTGVAAPYRSCLRVRSLATGGDRSVVCDGPSLTYTWGTPRFGPEGRYVFFNGNRNGDRRRGQLLRVDLEADEPAVEMVTDADTTRRAPRMLRGWSDGAAVFTANDDGHWNLHRYDVATDEVRPLTRFDEDVTSAERTDDGILAVHRTPRGSTLVLVDPVTGTTRAEVSFAGTADVLDADGHVALVQHASPDRIFEAWRVDTTGGQLRRTLVVGLAPERERSLVACRARRVTIPTFDRELHAFLLEPREPLGNPRQKLALIRSFYGGKNAYERFDQILCAAGLTVVSPAVRGSYGFGKAFEALNDRDLGGDEIVDLFRVAAWVQTKTGLPATRIGVYGRSHGGYATMRALTFPLTSARGPRYPFGFGMSDAGFSDIETFYAATNIPDWVVLESGDPDDATDLARMRRRSALRHVDRLTSPLLLTHGERDARVPVEESRRFVAAARQRNKPVAYLEVAGQGHSFKGLEAQAAAWQRRLDFLQRVAARASRPPR